MRAKFILAVATILLVSSGCCCQQGRRVISIKQNVCQCAACTHQVGNQCETCPQPLTSYGDRGLSLQEAKALISPSDPRSASRFEMLNDEDKYVSTTLSFSTNENLDPSPLEDFDFSAEAISNRRVQPAEIVIKSEDQYYQPQPQANRSSKSEKVAVLPPPPSQLLAPQVQNAFNELPKVSPINVERFQPEVPRSQPELPVQMETPRIAPVTPSVQVPLMELSQPEPHASQDQPAPARLDRQPVAIELDTAEAISAPQADVDEPDDSSSEPALASEEEGDEFKEQVLNLGTINGVNPVKAVSETTEAETADQSSEEPIILHARARRQSQATPPQFDPKFGLPTTDNIEFAALPQLSQSTTEPSNQLTTTVTNEAAVQPNHSPSQQGVVAKQDGGMMLVVYRDEKGRLFLAPPAAHHVNDDHVSPIKPLAIASAPPATLQGPADAEARYYRAGQPMLRLKAMTPISEPTPGKSMATILFRDTVIVDGTHLLESPEIDVVPVGQLQADGKPSINHQQLREALLRLTPTPLHKLNR